MVEEVEDALLLQQPMHEVELGFAVLHDDLAFRVVDGESPLDLVDAGRSEDLLHHVDRALVLVNAAVLAVCERGERRYQTSCEDEGDAIMVDELTAIDHAGERSLSAALSVDHLQREGVSQQDLGAELGVLGAEGDARFVGLGERLTQVILEGDGIGRKILPDEVKLDLRFRHWASLAAGHSFHAS